MGLEGDEEVVYDNDTSFQLHAHSTLRASLVKKNLRCHLPYSYSINVQTPSLSTSLRLCNTSRHTAKMRIHNTRHNFTVFISRREEKESFHFACILFSRVECNAFHITRTKR